MNADGSGLKDLSNSPASFDGHPDWSPDGSKIAFESNRDTPGFGVDVYVMNADGSDATRLTNNGAPGNTFPEDWFPSWQPIKTGDTTPPVITVPAPITANATSPGGAVVTYPVTATDPDDAVASLRCSPASGAVFPIRKTRVTCTAVDTHGNTSTASFTVTVKGAKAQLRDLLTAVTGAGPGTSLADKVKAVQSYLAAGDLADACSALTAFLHEVSAQSGKSIPANQAATLIATAQRIKAVLAC